MNTIDKAIRNCDSAKDDFNKAMSLLNQLESIVKSHSRKIDYSSFYGSIDSMKKKLQYYIDNADKGWYD